MIKITIDPLLCPAVNIDYDTDKGEFSESNYIEFLRMAGFRRHQDDNLLVYVTSEGTTINCTVNDVAYACYECFKERRLPLVFLNVFLKEYKTLLSDGLYQFLPVLEEKKKGGAQ